MKRKHALDNTPSGIHRTPNSWNRHASTRKRAHTHIPDHHHHGPGVDAAPRGVPRLLRRPLTATTGASVSSPRCFAARPPPPSNDTGVVPGR
eukprot:2315477-Rhodomonas_salina.1